MPERSRSVAPTTAGVPSQAPLCSLRLAPLGLAGLLVMPLAAHIGEDAGPLDLAAELPQRLLEVLTFLDLNLQTRSPLFGRFRKQTVPTPSPSLMVGTLER